MAGTFNLFFRGMMFIVPLPADNLDATENGNGNDTESREQAGSIHPRHRDHNYEGINDD
jgi:hypothetical protein